MDVFLEFSESQRIVFSNKVISIILSMKAKDRDAFLIVLCWMSGSSLVFLRSVLRPGSNVVPENGSADSDPPKGSGLLLGVLCAE